MIACWVPVTCSRRTVTFQAGGLEHRRDRSGRAGEVAAAVDRDVLEQEVVRADADGVGDVDGVVQVPAVRVVARPVHGPRIVMLRRVMWCGVRRGMYPPISMIPV